MASKLAEFGPEGAEELTRILNAYYGQLVDILQAHGADIVNFAGDAILCVWQCEQTQLSQTVVQAVQGCLEVQQKLNDYEVVPGVRLSLRMTLGAGEVCATSVGGVGNFSQLMLVGQPLDQLWQGDKLARVGDVVLSSHAWEQAKSAVDGERLTSNFCRVRAVVGPQKISSLPVVELGAAVADVLRAYVPPAVLVRVDAGQANFLADLRRVTVLFIKFFGMDAKDVSQLQTLMELLQSVILRYEGTVVQLMTDDKGTVGIACFGLPPITHEDDAVRAILAAHGVQAELAKRGWNAGIGIATGRVFCGPLGSPSRRIYTIIGNKVNLAARLMQQAANDIYCDEETERATRGKIKFHPLPRFVIKGMTDPLPVFRPAPPSTDAKYETIIGRAAEREAIARSLQALADGQSSALIIEGEGGIGKSTLVEGLLVKSQELGHRPLVGHCSSIEKQTSYFAWRAVFSQLLQLDSISSPPLRRAKVLEFLSPDAENARLFPLLNPVLGVDFPENEIVAQLDGRTRAENLHALLLDFLEQGAVRQRLVIVLDDVQWLDSASWRFFELVRKKISPLCLAVAMRPLKPPHPEEYQSLLEAADSLHLKLTFLNKADGLDLAKNTFGIHTLSERLADYIFERSQGNPFFVREMANFLRDAGLVLISDGTCDLRVDTDGDAIAAIPTAIGDLITSRIDQLTLAEQMTLKTASVIGRSFPHPTLKDVYPVETERERLTDYLQMLERQDLTGIETLDPILRYIFKHITIQQTAYNQLPVANRKQLHEKIAQWYESRYGHDPSHYPLLAYHWGKTENAAKHIEYLAKSGEEALHGGANREAIKFFEQSLQRQQEYSGEPNTPEDRLQRARWQRKRGDALYHLGQFPESRICLLQALSLLGRPMPVGRRRLWLNTIFNVVLQLTNRLRRKRAAAHDGSLRSQALQEAALANQRLARICYFENLLLQGSNHILRAVNEGEAAATSPELSRAYGKMCVCMSLLPNHRFAEHYAKLAISTARETNDLASIADALSTVCMYRLGVGQWTQVAEAADECVALGRQLADMERLAYGTTTLALNTCFQAKFSESLGHFQKLHEIGVQSGSVVYEAWGLCGQAECLLRRGDFEAAVHLLEETRQLLKGKDDRTEDVRAHGLLALATWRYGQEFTSLQHCATTAELIVQSGNPTCTVLEGYAGLAEVSLAHWEKNISTRSCRENAQRALSYCKNYARIFPIGRPRTCRYEGWFHLLSGNPHRATRLWRKGLEQANQFKLDFEAALLQYELGRHSKANSPDREQLLSEALKTFERLEVPFETQQTLQSLQN